MARRIVLLGGPGAGKGTQARVIAEAYELPHVSTGDIFRAHVEAGTEIGKQLKGYLDQGQLAPDPMACEVVAARLGEPDCSDGYILDGFPRSMPQATELERLLGERRECIDAVISLNVPDDEIVARLTARRTCPKCGAIYNLRYFPPAEGAHCDEDGAELVQRDDDKEATIRERLRVYHEKTEPLTAYYTEKGLLRALDAQGKTPDEVTAEIRTILGD